MEMELKYAVADQCVLDRIWNWKDILALSVGQPQQIHMQSQYYDTQSGAFSAKRWTLRKRQENHRCVIALKTPSKGSGPLQIRGEWECSGVGVLESVDALLALGAPEELKTMIDGQLLIEICSAQFLRKTRVLQLDDQTTVELALDFGLLTGGNHSMDLCEVELELLTGNVALMETFGQTLGREFSLSIETKSKFVRAISLK